MDPEERKRQKNKVLKIFNIKEHTIFKNDDYIIKLCSEDVKKTGYQVVFEIIPRKSNLPKFIGRWDEKDGNEELNIDILGVTKKERQSFVNSKNGCSGHHVKKAYINTNRKEYNPLIKFYGQKIYEGCLHFNLGWGVKNM